MTSPDDKTASLEQIGQRIDNAWERLQAGKKHWVEGSLEIAAVFAEARKELPSHAAFSAWLKDLGCDAPAVEIADMAKDPDRLRKALELCNPGTSWLVIIQKYYQLKRREIRQ